MSIKVDVEFIAASCNLTYNCLELTSDDTLVFGSNHSICVYDLQESKVARTYVSHTGRVNCVRFVKRSNERYLISACSDGKLIVWENQHRKLEFHLEPKISYSHKPVKSHVTVCDGIIPQDQPSDIIVGYITSKIFVGTANISGGSINFFQEIDLNRSVALDLVFDFIDKDLIMGLGMDSGEITLYKSQGENGDHFNLTKSCSLKKHEDWVRCLTITTLENGDQLLATGGEDSYITIWRIKPQDVITGEDDFEFQVVKFGNRKIVFDSMIIGHEGWINSLQWNTKGELISCSSDQTVIIWENVGDLWTEKMRLGVVGGEIPGGFSAKFNEKYVATSGFQGAVQIWSWSKDEEEWIINPSVTGHFSSVSDLDYHPEGHYLITTSTDQTTRVFGPWGLNRWHEISRPQIHGHDIFAIKCAGDYIISGAEEKILRAFQPTQLFVHNFEDASGSTLKLSNVGKAASLPALGLSNQSEGVVFDIHKRLEERLEDDFLRSQTLWPEVSKLYGHGYEICTIGASRKDPIIVSGCNSSKPQFSSIMLWCTKNWKKIGEFQFHKLNVTSLEFSFDGTRLLSASRDRTWALWNVIPPKDESNNFSLELIQNDGFHTRAINVATWSPSGHFFVTGSRDKKLVVWKSNHTSEMKKYENRHVESFQHPVSAAAVNEDGVIAVGLDNGEIILFLLKTDEFNIQCVLKLNHSLAHHDVVKKLKFNPKEKNQLASGSADHSVKIYQLELM